MHEICGQFFDGRSARSREARLRIYPDGTVLLCTEGEDRTLRFEELEIGARLGDTPRRVGLPGTGQFETRDNDGVDAALGTHAAASRNWIHRLEHRLPLVVAATVLLLVAGSVFYLWGIPVLAREAAFAVSPETSKRIGAGTLEILDFQLGPTALSEVRQAELTSKFERVVADEPAGYDFELLFRSGGRAGANAFALPSGTVLFTDELVGLAEHDEEIVAVMAHEVGHVVHRHGLRQVIQGSVLAVTVMLVSGDLSSTSGAVAALPTALANSSFSRDFEREADDHALAYMRANGIATSRFAALLERLAEEQGEAEGVVAFLSTHPATEERLEHLDP